MIFDADWRLVFVSDELLRFIPEADSAIGKYFWGWSHPDDLRRAQFQQAFSDVVMSTPGGREGLRTNVGDGFTDLVDTLDPGDPLPAHSDLRPVHRDGLDLSQWTTTMQIRDEDGRLAGFLWLQKPAAGMSSIAMVTWGGDTRHIDRIFELSAADRRPAAILFADLESSTHLSRTLSTSDYFDLARRLVRAADESVVEAGGVVGRHLGDGVTAFFLEELLGSESAAAAACITASRSLRVAVFDIADRFDLDPEVLMLRFGLHWGSTLHMGLFRTIARSEVTAMGDEVNETSRIEACATGGRTLASKALVERLSKADATELGLERVTYTLLGELPSASEKARRDAPSIPVCEI